MAVVKQEEVRLINGDSWMRKIKFFSKSNSFEIQMPPDFIRLFPDLESVSGESIKVVLENFDKQMENWKNAIIQERKIIAFVMAFNRQDTNEDGKSYTEFRHLHYSINDCPDTALGFSYEVAYERIVGKKKTFFTVEENPFFDRKSPEGPRNKKLREGRASLAEEVGHYRRDKDEPVVIIVEWTAEREKFFKELRASMDVMVERAVEFQKSVSTPVGLEAVMKRMTGADALKALPAAETENPRRK